MKSIKRTVLTLGILFFAGAIAGTALAADDIVKVAPENCKVVFENDEVRVIEYTGKPGQKVGMHWHPDHVIYYMSAPGATKFTGEDGKTMERTMKQGEAAFVKAGSHATEHMGPEEIKVLMVELKKK